MINNNRGFIRVYASAYIGASSEYTITPESGLFIAISDIVSFRVCNKNTSAERASLPPPYIFVVTTSSRAYLIYPDETEHAKLLNPVDPLMEFVHELRYNPGMGTELKKAKDSFYSSQ